MKFVGKNCGLKPVWMILAVSSAILKAYVTTLTFAVFLSKLRKYNSLLPLLVDNVLLRTREEDLR